MKLNSADLSQHFAESQLPVSLTYLDVYIFLTRFIYLNTKILSNLYLQIMKLRQFRAGVTSCSPQRPVSCQF